MVPARAGVHRSDHHKARRVREGHDRPRNGDRPVLHGLAEHFEHVSAEFRHLVQEKDPVVGQADFAGLGDLAASDEPRVGDGMMRVAERARVVTRAWESESRPHTL